MTIHRRCVIALFYLGAFAAACSESPPDPVGAVGTQTFAPMNLESGSITVYGGTYGPQGQFITSPSCMPTDPPEVTQTLGYTADGKPVTMTFTDNVTGDGCHVFRNPDGGQLYVGGVIYANVAGIHVEMPAKFTHTAQMSVPSGATMELGVVVSSGYRFINWLITRPDFSQYRTTTPTLAITAETADRVYVAELQLIPSEGNPTPEDPPSNCIDPTQPSCDP